MLVERLGAIEERIKAALKRSGREVERIELVAVSKKQPLELMLELERIYFLRGEFPTFGENYVQEFKKKREALSSSSRVHLIGPLQRNKAKEAVRLFDLIESVHSKDLALALNNEAEKAGKIQEVLFQVNISSDAQKSGFDAEELIAFLPSAAQFRALKPLGLMTITRNYDLPEQARADFRALRDLGDVVKQKFSELFLPPRFELSMGMSSDFEVAIEEGATMVRIGTALFGERE